MQTETTGGTDTTITNTPTDTTAPAKTEAPATGIDSLKAKATETTSAATTESTTPAATTTPPAFTPSLKFKVRDKELDMDPWVKDLVKDAEVEKKFQDLYTRGHGLEIAKQERDEFKTKLTGIEQGLDIINGYVAEFKKNPTTGHESARKFIEALDLPKEMFLQYALQELKYHQMTPEQRQEIDAQRQQQTMLEHLQWQNQQLSQQTTSLAVQQRNRELELALSDQVASQVAQGYDTRVGKPGAFRSFVIERGIYHEKINGADISPQQAVQEAIQILGVGTSVGTPNTSQAGQVGTQPAQTQNQKPVLPNIQGQGTSSPAKRVVKSIDDLKNRYKELTAQG